METDRLKSLQNSTENVIVIDVREDAERAISYIPHSITQKIFEENQQQYSKYKVITYCTIGYRSGKYAEKLRAKNIDAYNLDGSLLGWVHDGGKLVDANGQVTKKIHVYGKRWNLAPNGYIPIW